MNALAEPIPLPEHPRPDFQREDWLNLNGPWKFRFDKQDVGLSEKWFEQGNDFEKTILVPFSWGSKLSQVSDEADIAWYAKTAKIPSTWKGKRIFFVVGACDWKTTVWLNGQEIGSHQGGYTPFAFELTPRAQAGDECRLALRVDDTDHPFKLNGKQGYGKARGLWQTPYLEARGTAALSAIHFTPDIDQEKVGVHAALLEPAPADLTLEMQFRTGEVNPKIIRQTVAKAAREIRFEVPIPHPRLWSLEDPFLYEVTVALRGEGLAEDRVNTYFGMRQIGVMNLPGTDYPYVSLNHKPIYLKMTLDQNYHPDGFYTFPSDDFMRGEILRSRRIGLNGMRIHVKTPIPRTLYWADRLGMLIMADVPNSWGELDADMRRESETALRGMIERDYNHPCVFSWVLFNETWGLMSGKERKYLPETQQWVASMYRLAKSLDSTRLVEDNSPCLNDHVITDLNSWHSYLPGYQWVEFLDDACKQTYPGSKWNFAPGYAQDKQPMLNSECGNVWGYDGSTGDVDWSWDYHLMMNAFRSHPKICGWLYTEHHDVINEWNGYYRFDRSNKYTGMDELADGMSLLDLHSPYYISMGNELCRDVKPGAKVAVPLYASFLCDNQGMEILKLKWFLYGWDNLGNREIFAESCRDIPFKPWTITELDPLDITMPEKPALAVLRLALTDPAGTVLHRNFTCFSVSGGKTPADEILSRPEGKLRVIRFAPSRFSQSQWSLKQWNVLDGLKVNGAGAGFFEYRIPWPEGLALEDVKEAVFRCEASAKVLFGKDKDKKEKQEGDFMLGQGTLDPSLNPNSYPMTDDKPTPGAVRVRFGKYVAGVFELPDDPADHRGILSWHSQLKDKKLREAGSYGYLVSAVIPDAALREAASECEMVIRLETDEALPGGLAIYGEKFGRYPLDPTLIFVLKK